MTGANNPTARRFALAARGMRERRVAATFRVARLPRRMLFDIPVAAVTLPQTLELIDRAISERRQLRIGVVNAAKIVKISRDTALRDAVLSSHVILADGFSVVVASRLLGTPLPERVTGIDVMCGILNVGMTRNTVCTAWAQPTRCSRGCADYSPPITRACSSWECGTDTLRPGKSRRSRPRLPRQGQTFCWSACQLLRKNCSSPGGRPPGCSGLPWSWRGVRRPGRQGPPRPDELAAEWYGVAVSPRQEPHRLWRRYLVTNILFCQMLLVEVLRGRLWRRADRGVTGR